MHHSEKDRLYAFRQMYRANMPTLVRFARRYIPAGEAEDVVQDVFLELWKTGKILNEESARSYLFTSVRNRCINYLKQLKELYSDDIALEMQQRDLDNFDSVEKLMIKKEELQQVYDRIEQLPDKCRRIFKLSYFDGKKSFEIAELLQLSIRTVEHQLYLGLKTLREWGKRNK